MGDGGPRLMWYVIWSHEHEAWCRPHFSGYTDSLAEAGRYSGMAAMGPVLNDVNHNEIAILEATALELGPPTFHPYDGLVADRRRR